MEIRWIWTSNEESKDPWSKVGKPSGVLVDEDIISLGTKGLLISEGFDALKLNNLVMNLRVGNHILLVQT